MSERENQLQQAIKIILSIDRGMSNCYTDAPDYYHGFLLACQMWASGNTLRKGFRRVVDAKEEMLNNKSDEVERGYDDALRMFQKAKSL